MFYNLAVALLAAASGGPVRVTTLLEQTTDGPQRIYVARVDLADPRVDVRVTDPIAPQPGDPEGAEARLVTVPEFAEREGALLAVNTHFFARLAGAPARWIGAQPVDLIGPSVSDGRVVSHGNRSGLGHPSLLLTRARNARIRCALDKDLKGQHDVVAGANHPPTRGCLLVERGRNNGERASEALRARHPRTAAGLTRDRRVLILAVVDGRQPGWSIGMTLAELAALMLKLGAHDAINLDGGGSASFVYRPEAGERVVNRPSDGSWRPVAGQLGIVLRPR